MLIGLSGKKQSGKNEAANILQELLPTPHEIHMFAYHLKKFVADILKVPITQLESEEFKNTVLPNSFGLNKTVRKLLQDIGIKMREIHPDFWVNSLFCNYNNSNWLITDVRFLNEVERIVANGGVLIRLERVVGKSCTVKGYKGTFIITSVHSDYYSLDNHFLIPKNKIKIIEDDSITETSLDNYAFQHVIHNNYDKGYLKLELLKIILQYGINKATA